MDSGTATTFILLNLTDAFDTVHYDILLHRLEQWCLVFWSCSQLLCILYAPSNSISLYQSIHIDSICLKLCGSTRLQYADTVPVYIMYHSTRVTSFH